MQHYVYKIINITNDKFYIGVHFSKDPYNDGYFGSGKLIKSAIAKYGKCNFRKEILSIHSSRKAAFDEEQRIVTLDLIQDEQCYNLIIGGTGDNFGIPKNIKSKTRKPLSAETRLKISLAQKGKRRAKLSDEHRQLLSELKRGKTPKNMLPENKAETIAKMVESKKRNIAEGKTVPTHRGRSRTDADKKKISDALKGNIPWNAGKKMSEQFKEKCRNVPAEKRGRRKELIAKLAQINMSYEDLKKFVLDNFQNGLRAHSIHKKLGTDLITVSPIKLIIREFINENNQYDLSA